MVVKTTECYCEVERLTFAIIKLSVPTNTFPKWLKEQHGGLAAVKQVYTSLLPDLSKALNLTVCQVLGKTQTAAYYHTF